MPDVVKFETVIPNGWERCEWEESEGIAWGKKVYEYAHTIYSVSGLALMSNGQHEASFELCADRGIIPIRKKVVKPLEIEFKPVHDYGHFMGCDIVDQYGNKHNDASLKGKKFIEVME